MSDFYWAHDAYEPVCWLFLGAWLVGPTILGVWMIVETVKKRKAVK